MDNTAGPSPAIFQKQPVMRIYFTIEDIENAQRGLGRAGNDAEGIMFSCAEAVTHFLRGGRLEIGGQRK